LLRFADPPYSVTPDTGFVAAQGMLGDTALTILTAPDEPALIRGIAAITDPTQSAKIDGRAVALDATGGGLDLVAAREPTFFWTQSYGLGNDRLVAAGGCPTMPAGISARRSSSSYCWAPPPGHA